MERRTVLKGIGIAATGSGAFLGLIESIAAVEIDASTSTALPRPPEISRGDMRYRNLGRTGEKVSIIGVGGFHIGSVKEESEAIKIVRSAIDRGVTFMDNCWDYHEGESERRRVRRCKTGTATKCF